MATPYIPLTGLAFKEEIEPILIGITIALILFGVGLLQFWLVWRSIERLYTIHGRVTDTFHVVMLLGLLIFDIGDTIGKSIYYIEYMRSAIVHGFTGLTFAPRAVVTIPVCDGVIAMFTAWIYVRRIYRLSPYRHSWWFLLLLFVLSAISIVQCVCAFYVGHVALGPVTTWAKGVKPWADIWLGGAAIDDLLLCLVFVWTMRKFKSDYANTNAVVTRAINFTLECGLLTSGCQVLNLALFEAFENLPYHLAVSTIMPKLYINSVLILLRNMLENRVKNSGASGLSSSDTRGASRTGQTSGIRSATAYPNYQIKSPNAQQFARGVVITKTEDIEGVDVELPVRPLREEVPSPYLSDHSSKGESARRADYNAY